MKKILQIKTSKRRIAAASSLATAGAVSARGTQKTLHPLFVCSVEQREASNQRRLRTLLEEGSPCPKAKREQRPKQQKRNIANASLVPNLYLLATGSVGHSYVVPGFEEYFAHDDRSNSKQRASGNGNGTSNVNGRPSSVVERFEPDSGRTHAKLGSDNSSSSSKRSSPKERDRPRKDRTASDRCAQPKSSRVNVETSSRHGKDSFAKPLVVSPATTVTTATTSDQRIPEISALKEIITNHQVPSMIPCLTDKSPSCTPTHSVAPPLPADLDRRVLDWVDNCVSQEIAKDAEADVHKKKDAYEESLLNELQRSYLRLVDSEDCSDLVVETADRPIRAHKAILFVRCTKISQTLSPDSSFWHLKWCSSKAALYFLRYLYAADVSFVPGLGGQVRKDLLTLCCQYQTDELAARLIRERSPSPAQLTQHQQLTPQQRQSQQQSVSQSNTRKRSAESQNVELPLASENRREGSSASQKKTRMSITCETVSVTIPEDSRCSIQQSPRLPQSFPPFQQSTPFVTRITDDERRDGSARGSAEHPIELGSSSSDLFSDDDEDDNDNDDNRNGSGNVNEKNDNDGDEGGGGGDDDDGIVVIHPAPPLSPIHQTPTRSSHDEREAELGEREEGEEDEEAGAGARAIGAGAGEEEGDDDDDDEQEEGELPLRRSSHSFVPRKSLSQPIITERFFDSFSDSDARPQQSPRSSRLVDGLDVTPLPRYSTMKTPEMHKHLDRYGIKTGIGKQKAVKLLKHIYQATHPAAAEPAASSQTSSSGDDSDVPLEESMAHNDNGDEDDDGDDVSDNVEEKITRYIRKTPALYDRILRFEPVEVSDFKKELREHGIRINDKMLLNYLDFHCVNISFGTQRKAARSPKKARRKVTTRKLPAAAATALSQP